MNRRTFFNRLAMGVAGVMGLQVATVATGKTLPTTGFGFSDEVHPGPFFEIFGRKVPCKMVVLRHRCTQQELRIYMKRRSRGEQIEFTSKDPVISNAKVDWHGFTSLVIQLSST